jgi:hypothetical protein
MMTYALQSVGISPLLLRPLCLDFIISLHRMLNNVVHCRLRAAGKNISDSVMVIEFLERHVSV